MARELHKNKKRAARLIEEGIMKIIFDNSTLGECFVVPPEDRVLEYVEALHILGWNPEVVLD